jgi:mono/diheme cytochrome c family protein
LQHNEVKGGTMIGRIVGALSIGGMILGLAWAAQRADPPKEPLIASIQGPALYKAYCAACHGPEAKGNGPSASTLKFRPADLTRISARNGGTFPLMRIERIISGEEERRGHGAMPAWGPIFSEVGRDQDLGRVRVDNLARYLKEIQAK